MHSKNEVAVLTGGGTVGHVMLNKLLIPELLNQNITPVYIGSKKGIEKELIEETGISYTAISSGKLRRYFSLENAKDVFRVTKGIYDARRILKKIKPKFVFSKGGFVTVPVVLAARSLNIPVYIHESDITPGLANKIASKFATKIFVTFENTINYIDKSKAEYIGPVVREELTESSLTIAEDLTGFDSNKKTLLFMGGSLGAQSINKIVHDNIDKLTTDYQVIHITGPNNMKSHIHNENYQQYEFVKDDMPHLLKLADVVITRSGSNAIYELLFLKKPMLLIPLPLSQSRGDQVENATFFKDKGFAEVIDDGALEFNSMIDIINKIENNKTDYINKMNAFKSGTTPKRLVENILSEE